jgi:exosortase/archaeosortase
MSTTMYLFTPVIAIAILLGVVALIGLTLMSINYLLPELGDRIKDATPWLGWVEPENETHLYIDHYTRVPLN